MKLFIGTPCYGAKCFTNYVTALIATKELLQSKGIEVKMKPSIIHIHEIELLEYKIPEIKVRIKCSKGTYIRSLANDIGAALQSGGYLAGLRRTKIGKFSVEDALKIDEFDISEAEKQIA